MGILLVYDVTDESSFNSKFLFYFLAKLKFILKGYVFSTFDHQGVGVD